MSRSSQNRSCSLQDKKERKSQCKKKKASQPAIYQSPAALPLQAGVNHSTSLGLTNRSGTFLSEDGATLASFDHADSPSGICAAPTCLYQLYLRHHVRNSEFPKAVVRIMHSTSAPRIFHSLGHRLYYISFFVIHRKGQGSMSLCIYLVLAEEAHSCVVGSSSTSKTSVVQ